ncbi:MAG: hypothetical protein WAM53_00075, partial [Terrimicrobiaceae bacterium]
MRYPVNLREFILAGGAFRRHPNGGRLPVVLPRPAKIFGGGIGEPPMSLVGQKLTFAGANPNVDARLKLARPLATGYGRGPLTSCGTD